MKFLYYAGSQHGAFSSTRDAEATCEKRNWPMFLDVMVRVAAVFTFTCDISGFGMNPEGRGDNLVENLHHVKSVEYAMRRQQVHRI